MQHFDSRGGANRHKIETNFFKTWSNEMAYVLGFLYADGDIVDATKSSRTQYIKFSSKDKDILLSIKNVLQSEHPIYYRSPRETTDRNGRIYRSSGLFYLRIGSQKMFADLKKIGLLPNKSKIIKFPTSIPDKYLNQFIRGYFDGDGCIYLQRTAGKKQKIIFKKLCINFTSGSKTFLQGLSSNIKRIIDVNKDKVYNGKRAYQLVYSTSDTIKLFKYLYKDVPQNTYLERKFKIFLNYFQVYPNKIDKDIKKILESSEEWPGVRED